MGPSSPYLEDICGTETQLMLRRSTAENPGACCCLSLVYVSRNHLRTDQHTLMIQGITLHSPSTCSLMASPSKSRWLVSQIQKTGAIHGDRHWHVLPYGLRSWQSERTLHMGTLGSRISFSHVFGIYIPSVAFLSLALGSACSELDCQYILLNSVNLFSSCSTHIYGEIWMR